MLFNQVFRCLAYDKNGCVFYVDSYSLPLYNIAHNNESRDV